jgi:multidrug efflux pump subunit AcrB
VVGSTLTTVVVFAPLALLSGVAGQFFRALSITLSVAVLISLGLALTLIPLLARWSFAAARRAEAPRESRLQQRYGTALDAVMRRPRPVFLAMAGLVVAMAALFFFVPTGFLPHMDEGGFVIDYRTPPGTAIETTDATIRKAESILAATGEVAAFSRRTGSEMGIFATPANEGDILVRLKRRGARSRSSDEIIAELRHKLAEAMPGTEVEFVQLLQDMLGDLEGSSAPVEVKIFGDDPKTLQELSETLEGKLASIDGLVDIVGTQSGGPEETWQVDPAAAGRLGLSVADVTDQLHGALLGQVATSLRVGGGGGDRPVPVRVRYPDAVRFDPAQVAATGVRGPQGGVVPLGALAHPQTVPGESVLVRENLREMAFVTGRLEGRSLGSAVADVRNALASVKLPVGYTTEVGGQYESQQQAFRQILAVLAIAASLVLLLLVVEFRSFIPAAIILAAAPLSFGGALLVLLATGTELNVSSAMGFILLIGLTVKNGIVMLDYAHRLRDGGMPLGDAIRRAARVRLRPILMTTLCTLFGLLPLSLGLGAGAELQQPLALVVIGGLTLSTAVTLFAVPTIYAALEGWQERRRITA